MRVPMYYTNIGGKISYVYNKLENDFQIKEFDTEEEAVEQFIKDLEDDNVIQIDNKILSKNVYKKLLDILVNRKVYG